MPTLFKNSSVEKILFFCLLFSICLSAYGYANTTLKIGVYDNKPTIFVGDDGTVQGLFVDVLEEIAIKENWRLEYVFGEFSDVFTQLKEGEIDLLPAVAYSKQREEIIDFSNETVTANWGELYVSGDRKLFSLLELEGKKVGVLQGDIHFTALKELTHRFKISCRFIETDDYETVFEMLQANFVDVGVVNRLYGNRNKQKYSVEATPVIFNPIEMRFGATKGKYQNILTKIDSYMLRFSDDRQSIYYQSLNRWLTVDPEKEIPRWVFYLLIAVVGSTFFFFVVSLLFRRQVQKRTEELANANSLLKSQILERTKAEAEKQILETHLRQAQKMEAIGTLAGGIAHDFNNILSSIIGFTELALEEVEKESPVEESLREVYAAGNRAKDLVKQILAFARKTEEETKPIKLQAIAEEIIHLLRSSIPTSIEIITKFNSTGLIMGNPTQLHQIIMNLCTNAAHAMEERGGQLTISTQDVDFDQTPLAGLPKSHEKRYVRFQVSDTGTGIPAEIIDSIFEPYFTTKKTGEGTGMGLAMVQGIVESYGGHITVDSTLGEGSTFTIHLPLTAQSETQREHEPETLPTGTERILLVDDEAPIVRMSSLMLEGLGYQVTARFSSTDALELFKARPADFDLVISDMTMPDMTGDVLAIEMMRIRSDIRVILCTGYNKRISDKSAYDLGIKALVNKPFVRADLARAVRNVLDKSLVA